MKDMARDIDFDNLQEDDYPYLQARSGLVTEAELQGYKGIREEVDNWKPKDAGDYDAKQDVTPAPQTTGDAQLPTTPGDNTGEEEEEDIEYSEATVEQLKAELKERGLSTSGNKEELIARLEADDEEVEE
ncbi:DNA binding protein [Arthrobacter phage Wollypog]|uniref:DNA binding protein n=1 Tax=Arthrobacter phage Wollypog TaxID=2790985 RepID=A0A7T3KC62_9CAUD|nr:DNA binding protein [Arthrobacter phage Wollypog]QPX62560.1 DNA binding protein [Arthrobacter phage Wollypog]